MKKMNMNKLKQRGFTLIEVIVVLAILTLLAILLAMPFDNSRSRAQVMLGLGKQMADANIRLKADTGCYVNKPSALFDATAAALPANNYCNRAFGNNWSQNYLTTHPLDAAGDIKVEKISSGATAGFGREAAGAGQRYFVTFNSIPLDIAKQALLECNQDDATTGAFPTQRCRVDNLAGPLVKFEMSFDQTR
jgi:general secretion pathway protein G